MSAGDTHAAGTLDVKALQQLVLKQTNLFHDLGVLVDGLFDDLLEGLAVLAPVGLDVLTKVLEGLV